MILFSEKAHRYWNPETKEDYKSVSWLISMVKQPFDREGLSKKIAEKEGVSQQEILDRWDSKKNKACERGTKVHAIKEQLCLVGEENVFPALWDGEIKRSYDLKTLKPGTYPELILYLPEFRLCGTSDKTKIFTDKTFKIRDFKGFALDTKILTGEGWKTFGELTTNDFVYDGNGVLTKIKNVSQIHYNPCFRITFNNNATLVCDHEHKWQVKVAVHNGKWLIQDVDTETLFNYHFKQGIPVNIEVISLKQEDIDLPLDPYILGLWLGDGNRTVGTITCENDKIWKEIERRGFSVSVDHNRKTKGAESRTIFGISPHLRKLNLLSNKHIPDLYFRSSHKQRLDLLRGFMDADGYFNKTRNRCSMRTTKEWQRDEFIKLISSLGYRATVIPYKGSGFGKTNIQMYAVDFSPSENPFLCRNEDYLEHFKNFDFTKSKNLVIKNIEVVDTVPTKCIEVESDTHCYLVGYSFIKTHNTNEKLEFKGFPVFDPISKTRSPKKMLPPVSHLEDANGNHYALQLSIYAYILESYGYRCTGLYLDHLILNDNDEIINEKEYKVPYLKREVKSILSFLKSKKWTVSNKL